MADSGRTRSGRDRPGDELPDEINASVLWPESLIAATDAALAAFENELHALRSPSDGAIRGVVERVVLVGHIGYETGEREDLCEYIDSALCESGIDVVALAARNGFRRWPLTDKWRKW